MYEKDIAIVAGPGGTTGPAARDAVIEKMRSEKRSALIGRALADKWGWEVGRTIPIICTIFQKPDGSAWDFEIAGIFEKKRANVDDVFEALSDPTRRSVVDLLRRGPRRAGELAEALDMTPPALSRHLRVLRTRGLVEDERGVEDARVRVFRLRREPFDALQSWLERVESFWSDQLDSFKAQAEKRRRK